jgi:hypothetical protein
MTCGPKGAQSQVKTSVGQRVNASGRHGDQRGGAGVDRQDGRANVDLVGEGREISHERRSVKAVGLGNPDQVEAGLFHLAHLTGRFLEAAAVTEHCRNLHVSSAKVLVRQVWHRALD